MSLRFFSDSDLLSQCRTEAFRGSGPGGQKRQKTSNSIRLTHLPTNLHVVAGESRSQGENKTRALRRMRLKLAVEIREPIEITKFEPPDWFLSMRHLQHVQVSPHHPFYAAAIGLILDLFQAMNANPAHVAAMLGVSTTTIIKLLENEPSAWTTANAMRKDAGLQSLTHRK